MPFPILESKAPEALGLRVESALALRLRGRRGPVVASVHGSLDGDALIEEAEQIAGALFALGVGPGALVGLRLERAPKALAAQLGVLIAGAAWLPLDPVHPAARQAQLLADAGAALLLTEGDPPPDGCPCPALPLDAARGARLPVGAIGGGLDDPAYVLYTSGSTGKPKGAVLSHRSLAHVLDGMAGRLGLGPADRALAAASFAFDMSIVDTWMPIWAGGSVFLLGAAATQDGAAIAEALAAEGITHWNATPSTLRLALAAGRAWGGPLRVLSAGERLTADLAEALLARGVDLWNGYGLTETGIGSAFFRVRTVEPDIPAGLPLPGVGLAVVGPNGAPLPVGERGEIVIFGPGLMLGYRGRPAETAARLCGAPPGFFTGDAGYLRADGLLVVTGRLDDQLKLRGLRVEPGEIEAALLGHPALREVAVAARPGPTGELHLCAWLAPRGALADDALRAWLAARLPAPMVPDALVWLDALPRNPSGKIDRAALPAPIAARPTWLPPFRPPSTDDEHLLVRLMGELLGQTVGADDPLVELGGRSIVATTLAARVAELRGRRLPVSAILGEQGTAAQLAARLADAPLAPARPAASVARVARAPAAVAGIWALSRIEPNSAAWGTAIALWAEGPGDRRAAADALWREVEALRVRIHADAAGGVWLEEAPPGPAPLRSLATAAEEAAFLAEPAEVEGGPLARIGLTADGRLLLWMHHCIADAWSVGLLAEVYAAALVGVALPPRPLRLLDLGAEEAQNAHRAEGLAAAWAARLRGAPMRNDLPGVGRDPRAGGPASTVEVAVGGALGEAITALGRSLRATPAAALLAGLAAWLYAETGQDDQLLGVVLAGREGPDRSHLIGNLARALPVRLRLGRGRSGAAVVQQARAALLDAADHSEVALSALVSQLSPPRAADQQALFQVCFVGQDGPPRERRQGAVRVVAEEIDLCASPYDLLVRAEGEGSGLRLRLTARHSRVDPGALRGMAAGLRDRLRALCDEPSATLRAPALLAAAAALRRRRDCEDADVVWVPGEGPPWLGLVAGGPASTGQVALSRLPRDKEGRLDEEAARAAVLGTASPLRRGALHRADLLPGALAGPAPQRAGGPAAIRSTAPRPALRVGRPALPLPAPGLAALLERAAASTAPLTFLDADLQPEVLSYADLWREARAVAGGLRRAGLGPGQAVVLALPEARGLVPALWGCFLAGVAALPVAAPLGPGPSEARLRLGQAVDLLGGAPVLTDPARMDTLAGLVCLDGRALREGRPDGDPQAAGLDDLALLLLTSGSTGAPKAVTHGARTLLSFLGAYGAALDLGPQDVFLNWLGLDHVAPLLMVHASAVMAGAAQVHAPTWAFLSAPARALDWAHRYRATTTFAPNFAYGLLAEAAAGAPEGAWDLRCARAFTNGGETLVPATTRRFLDAAGRFGFPEAAMVPIWGMSETCSATILRRGPGPGNAASDPGTLLGGPVAGFSMRVVDAAGALRDEGEIGHLQVQGVMVTPGYLRRPEANAAAFTADGWFDTGDLGFIDPGGLVLTGRAKDLIIVAGRNLGCHEVEAVVEGLPGVARSFVAATPLRPPGAETDEVGVFFATDLPDEALPGLYAAARAALGAQLGFVPACLLAVSRDDIPKTEIGKLQRSRLRARFEAGDFDAAVRAADLRCENERTLPDWFAAPAWLPAPAWPAEGSRWWVAAATDDPRADALPGAQRLAFGAVAEALATGGPAGLLWIEPDRGGDSVEAAIEAALALQAALAGPVPTRLVVAVDQRPRRAGALGALLATLVQERPPLQGRLVEDGGAEGLIAEATLWGPPMEHLRYRAGRRLRRGWRAPAFAPPGPLPFEAGDLVVISGGAGALGALVASALLRLRPVSLLLLGRRPAADPEVAAVLDGLAPRVRALRGARLRYAAVDLADGPALSAALREAESALGQPLRFVLHLAGVAELRLFAEEDRAGLERAVAGRARGLLHLAAEVAQRPGARLLRFGSLNDQLGGFAAGAYAFAGGLAAAMAEAEGLWSLSWSAWLGRGLGRLGGSGQGALRRGLRPIVEEAGLASLIAALHQGPGDLAIGLDGAHAGLRSLWEGLPVQSLAAPVAPRGVPVGDAPQTETERRLAALWMELLGRSTVGRDDGFFDLGGTSLLLVALHSRLVADFPGAPRLVELLANPTLRTLAARLDAAPSADPALAAAAARGAQQRAALGRRRPPERPA